MRRLPAVDVKGKIKSFSKRRGADIAAKVAEAGVDGISNWMADELEAEGDPETAAAVRESADVIESAIRTMADAAACFGTVRTGVTIGAVACIAGPLVCAAGMLAGAAVGGILNPACKNALVGAFNTGTELGEAIDAIDTAIPDTPSPTPSRTCGGNSFPTADAPDCVLACEPRAEGGSSVDIWCACSAPAGRRGWLEGSRGHMHGCSGVAAAGRPQATLLLCHCRCRWLAWPGSADTLLAPRLARCAAARPPLQLHLVL